MRSGTERLARPTRGAAIAACIASLAVLGCGLGGDRVESHLARADDLLAEGRGYEALLELKSAAQLRPDDAALGLRVARAASRQGYTRDAVEFYEDVLDLRPDDLDASIELARLLIPDDPERAEELVTRVLQKDARHPGAALARGEMALAANDVQKALQRLRRAQIVAPDEPDVYWALARAHEARVRSMRSRAGTAIRGTESLEPILEAYRQYVAKGGERRLLAALGHARAVGSWTGLGDEGRAAYAAALDEASSGGLMPDRILVASATSAYAHAIGDTDLERRGLELSVALTPDHFQAWSQLAALPGPDGRPDAEAVYRRMLDGHPDDPRAHIAYGRHLARTAGYGAGLGYLREQMDRGLDDAALLTGIVNLQHEHRRPLDAARTIDELKRVHPDQPATRMLVARQQIREGQSQAAARELEDLLAVHESTEAYRLLARAEYKLRRYDRALDAIERANAVAARRIPENMRLKARIHAALGEPLRVASVLRELQRVEPLTLDDRLMLAAAYYDSHRAIHGRQILEQLLSEPDPSPRAALAYAEREAGNRHLHAHIREHLEAAHQSAAGNVEVLAALTELDLAAGERGAAIGRLTAALKKRPRAGRLYLLRARTLMTLGLYKEALADAERAAVVKPAVADEAYELIAHTYLSAAHPERAIRQLEALDEKGELSANRMALLGRLHLHVGDGERARTLYERALESGSELALLKNDLAFLLARNEEDLDRALELAVAAAEAENENLSAADTLGYVHLKRGNPEAAYWQFRFVTQEASPPVAEYYYHLGLALIELGRLGEARDALDRALAIDPEDAAARTARNGLDASPPSAPEA